METEEKTIDLFPEKNSIYFKTDDDVKPIMKISNGKFYWKDEEVDDIHNVYERFNDWLTRIEPTEERGNMVKLLRWVLKHYSTGTDIDGMFMWENPIEEEFDSMQVVDHYLKENK
jgi:hypothetical protein